MKILITGGAGYKGITLTKKLLELGHNATILDNFMYGYEPIMHLVNHPKLHILKADIRNGVNDLGKYDAIFHLAGISGFPACAANPHSAHLINVEATKNLVANLSKDQIFINASTTSLYGKSLEPCSEETQVDPVSTYAMTKYEAEKIVADKENTINLRFATVFGVSPKIRMDLMINDFVYKALKEKALVLFDSAARRTFIHVEDAADCYIFALNNFDKMKGKIFNAGSNNLNYSKHDLANIIREKFDFTIVNSEMKDKDVRNYEVDFQKINQLGFSVKKNIEEGINELIKLFEFYEVYSYFKII